MSEQPVIVQKVSWRDLFPWTNIFKTLSISASVPVLVFALLGVVLTPVGWLVSETLFVHEAERSDEVFMEQVAFNRSPYRSFFDESKNRQQSISVLGLRVSGPRLVFQKMTAPFRQWFEGSLSIKKLAYFVMGSLFSLVIWSFVGIAIARVCLLRLARNEPVGIDDAFEFAMDKGATAMGAIGIPLLAVVALCVPLCLFGMLMGFDVGVLIVGVLWFVVLLIAAAMTWLLLGLFFGWPLMIPSVAAESQNAFDAMTRSYAYVFQRPLHYLFYAVVAMLFGGFCWVIVLVLTHSVIELSFWATSLGANLVGNGRIESIRFGGEEASQAFQVGQNMIGWWTALLKTIAVAFLYGLFWCMASAIYLVMRYDVDETEMDEVFVANEQRTYDLPPLQSDEKGIPCIQTPTPVEEEASHSEESSE